MSRHIVEHKSENDLEYWISFGWDRPTSTFFMQVEEKDEEEVVFDIGSIFTTRYTEIDGFAQACSEKLAEIGINDFELSQEQKFQLLNDMNGIGN
ncbi:hypothetical protein S7335_1002 [Synechococcus sp. PCC 7335]|uniref:hypothetical protein n=1 Tax=Synechococcus sp. (strain ATCC 29403 / PCC 7335) TaxID=91464 RepID=UPI00017EC81E|nr:hypothetical protein [Synechococcus sp. PCC 7335]EDX82700.1 hypothetical protein S7335_1002 [Synechococcus sp. PCC 7335]